MIRVLRQRHLQVWLLLGFLLLLGIISAWLAVPATVKDRLMQPFPGTTLPVVLEEIQKPAYTIRLRASGDSSKLQLEWMNQTVLTAPSAIIYQLKQKTEKIEDADIIGRIEGRGSYYFPLRKDSAHLGFHFVLYDIIHQQVIDQINFKP